MFRLFLGALLTLSLAGVMAPGPAAAQAVTSSSSYQQSCRDIRTRNDGTIVALCPMDNGQMVRTQIDPQSCRGRSRDIANMNGQLTCVRLNGTV